VTKREIFFLLYDQAKKILLPRFDTGDAEYWFMEDLRAGLIRGEVSMSALYSRWRAARAEMLAEYEQAQAMNPVGRFLRCIKLNLRRRLKFKRPVKKR
jgi:hypothetical protein